MELFRGHPDVKTAVPIILASSAHHSSRPSYPVGQPITRRREKSDKNGVFERSQGRNQDFRVHLLKGP